jgi:TIR domain
MERSKQVFISYARENRETALDIHKTLETHGFETWIDSINLLPGQDWANEIARAIRASGLFLACLSRTAVTKQGFVQSELKRALKVVDSLPSREVFIIPVRLDECEIPSELEQYHWLDYFEKDGEERLLRAISAYTGKLATSLRSNVIAESGHGLWIGGGTFAISDGTDHPLAHIFDPTKNSPARFLGDACAVKFTITPKAPWVSLDDIYIKVGGYRALPPYETRFPLPFQEAHVYYVEIDAPSPTDEHVFHAKYWSKEGPMELGSVLLTAGKPEVFVLRINARTPGIYSFSGYATVSSESSNDNLQIFEDKTFWFDDRAGIR